MRQLDARSRQFLYFGLSDDIEDAAKDQASQAALAARPTTSSGVIDHEVVTLKRAVIEAAATSAAASMAITYVIAMIPIVGTAVAAIISLIQLFTSPYIKNQIREVVGNAVADLKRTADAANTEMVAYAMKIADEEYPAAQQLAASGQPLDGGLGSIANILRAIAKPIAKPLTQIHAVPLKVAGNVLLKTGLLGAKLVHDKHGEALDRKMQGKWDEKMAKASSDAETTLLDPEEAIRVSALISPQLLFGTNQISVVRKRAQDLVTKGTADLNQMKIKSISELEGPAYRMAVRTNLAKAMRGDPTLLARAQALAQEQQRQLDEITAAATPPGGGGAATLGVLAVVGYLFFNK